MNWIYLAIAVIAEVIATSALKSAEGFTKLLPSAIVVIGYITAFYFLSLTLKTIPVGIIYAIWSGAGIVLVCLVAWLLHGQTLNVATMIGIAMIISGVLIINTFSNNAMH